MSPAQRRACEELLPRYGVTPAPALDFEVVFGRKAPVVLEIGFGMGETTAAIAGAHPQVDFLAVDVHLPGVGALLRSIAASELTNLRVLHHDALEVVGTMIAPATLSGIHVFFPDPWPKKRHHKRRLLGGVFVHELALRLALGGYLHVATDWEDYAQEILAALESEPMLANAAPGFASRPAWRPLTKFERRGIGLGHTVRDLVFRRRGDGGNPGWRLPNG
jgi:tRNA (guanine-N7-)-methyltransferase